ncbi:MAG: hypothetical protein H7Y31_08685 [Chitinophagaceae bacterium]|nr:hypothetical protein [Chitinophagaceae bacterium]
MKPLLIGLLFILTFITSSFAQIKDTAYVGVYINAIYDFKIDDKSFMADFWMWVNHRDSSNNFENILEITNSKTASFDHFDKEKKGGGEWVTMKCNAEVVHEWDVSCFPFDRQILRIQIEDSENDTSKMVYVADTVNSKIDSLFDSKEWRLVDFSIKEDVHTYNTTYGNPDLSGTSSYPRVVATIEIKRNNSWVMLGKMLTGAYVAFFISCLVFFVSSENQDSRFGLCVGGLFAAIGNKYIVESVVPSSSTNTLMDNAHNLTFTFILLIVLVIVVSLYLFESGDEKKKQLSLKLDKIAFFSILTAYTVINAWLVYKASS